MMIVVLASLDVLSFSVTSIPYRGEPWSIYSVYASGATTRVAPTMDGLNVHSPLVRRSLRPAQVFLRSDHEY